MEKQKEVEKRERIKCAKCGSKFIYIRIKDKTLVCRSCGNIDKEVVL